jgi:hypothetical protein
MALQLLGTIVGGVDLVDMVVGRIYRAGSFQHFGYSLLFFLRKSYQRSPVRYLGPYLQQVLEVLEATQNHQHNQLHCPIFFAAVVELCCMKSAMK